MLLLVYKIVFIKAKDLLDIFNLGSLTSYKKSGCFNIRNKNSNSVIINPLINKLNSFLLWKQNTNNLTNNKLLNY